MGLIARLRRLTTSRIEVFLSTVEDPEVLFPQLVKEMEDQVRSATEAEAKAMASVKGAERDLKQIEQKLDRMTKGAELAVDKGDEDTAREAVSAQIDLESEIKRKQEALKRSQAAMEDARAAREQVQAQLAEVRNKKDEILTRARVIRNQKKVERTVSAPVSSARSILDAVAQLETKVEEQEAEIEVQRDMASAGGGPSLDKRLKDLEVSSEVEERLAKLKKKTGKASKE
jgi:phage shock protein A